MRYRNILILILSALIVGVVVVACQKADIESLSQPKNRTVMMESAVVPLTTAHLEPLVYPEFTLAPISTIGEEVIEKIICHGPEEIGACNEMFCISTSRLGDGQCDFFFNCDVLAFDQGDCPVIDPESTVTIEATSL